MNALLSWNGKGMRTRMKLMKLIAVIQRFKISCEGMLTRKRVFSECERRIGFESLVWTRLLRLLEGTLWADGVYECCPRVLKAKSK